MYKIKGYVDPSIQSRLPITTHMQMKAATFTAQTTQFPTNAPFLADHTSLSIITDECVDILERDLLTIIFVILFFHLSSVTRSCYCHGSILLSSCH